MRGRLFRDQREHGNRHQGAEAGGDPESRPPSPVFDDDGERARRQQHANISDGEDDPGPNRAADICFAASVIGHISMPDVATPSRNCPTRKPSGPVARPDASAPTIVPANRPSETGRTPKRSIAAPTGICEAAKAK